MRSGGGGGGGQDGELGDRGGNLKERGRRTNSTGPGVELEGLGRDVLEGEDGLAARQERVVFDGRLAVVDGEHFERDLPQDLVLLGLW